MTGNNYDLSIGVDSDLKPFTIDLKALTRGLAVIGQSGCGKSFLLGRLMEELAMATSEKTRVLIIDSNSDFCYGFKPKHDKGFRDLCDKYKSGLLETGFQGYNNREKKAFKKFNELNLDNRTQIFGNQRGRDFNLHWKYLIEDEYEFFKVICGNEFSSGLKWALAAARKSLKEETLFAPRQWVKAIGTLMAIKNNPKKIEGNFPKGIEESLLSNDFSQVFLDLVTVNDLRDFSSYIIRCLSSPLFRENDSSHGLPEMIFNENKISVIEIETLDESFSRLMLIVAILEYCWREHVRAVEKYRKENMEKNDEEIDKSDLKHTFILIDEVHNYAPNDSNDPHERFLGDIIHKIAAEGRKYGIHLILATQRPQKIKRGILGECDNAIIMKMNSRSDLEHLSNEMRILDVKLIEPCLHFQGQGNAIAIGEMTKMAPYTRIFKTAPRRTMEGGVDIPDF